jgi:hypothetical protein
VSNVLCKSVEHAFWSHPSSGSLVIKSCDLDGKALKLLIFFTLFDGI